MNLQLSKAAFASLSLNDQLLFLAKFAHELTTYARDTYEQGTDAVINPPRLRFLNEIQHRVTSAIVDRLQFSDERYPDDVLTEIMLGRSVVDPALECLFSEALEYVEQYGSHKHQGRT